MKRNILGLLLILCLALLLPAAALAGGADEGTEGAPCSLTEGCTLPDDHEGECVVESPQQPCSQTEGCTLPGGHEGECVVESPQQPCSQTEGCTLPAGHEGECVVESPQQPCSLTEGCTLPGGHEDECVTAPANEEENPLPDDEGFPTNGPMLRSGGNGEKDTPWLVESAEELTDAFNAGGYIQLKADITVSTAQNWTVKKDVVLDLNGHTVTSRHNASNYFLFTVSDAELTIDDSSETKNGMIDTSSAWQTGGVKVYNNGTFTLAGGSFQTQGVALDVPYSNTNVTINISGGSLTSTNNNVMRISGKGTKIHVSDGYVRVDSPVGGIFLSGSSDNAADRIQFEISGGEVAVTNGIRAVKNVSLTLSGNGKVIAGTTIKLEENSSLLVSGGTSVGNLDANNTCDISMRGGKVEGSVILKDQSTFTLSAGEIIDDTWHAIETRGQNSVTINGGSIETKSTQRAAVAINADSTATITGGFFTGKQTVTGTVGNVVISGGKFSGDVSQYIAAQHSGLVTQDADYPFWVGDYNDETAQQALENKGVARLQVNQANVYYTSLQEAVAAAGENAVITLIADTDEAFAIGKPLIIMRNGFTASQISAGTSYRLVKTEGSYLIIPAPVAGTTYTVKYYLENVEQAGDAQSGLTADALPAALSKTYADHHLLQIVGPGEDNTYRVYYARNLYQVTVQILGRGTAEATPNSAISGSNIQLSATAQPGYRFAGWRVLAGDVTIAADGSFTMPQQNVTVLATFILRSSGSSSSSSRDYYQLRFDVNGGNAISPLRRVENTTIDLNNYTPVREGYRFTGWYADAALSERITSIRLTEDTTVYAGWQKITQLPFLDIDETDSYYDAVCYVYENGLIIGTSDTLYSPDMSITRGMIATILWRVEGKPAAGANPFPDVAAGSYYESAIAWAAANGVINGYEDGNYRPNEAISREELAAILYRYALNKGYASAAAEHAALTQADAGTVLDWAVPAMQWACETGVLSARADGLLQPGAEASRAETAVAFYVLAGTLAAQ